MRMCPVAIAALLLLLFALELPAQSPLPKSVPTLNAVRASEKIAVDGALNDAPWMKAPVEWNFTQRDPIEGAEPSERTEIRIAYDETLLSG